MSMPDEFKRAQKYVTAIRRENKRHGEALARAEENHAERMREIEAEAALTAEEKAIADMVMKRPAPVAAVPDLEPAAKEEPSPGPPRQARR